MIHKIDRTDWLVATGEDISDEPEVVRVDDCDAFVVVKLGNDNSASVVSNAPPESYERVLREIASKIAQPEKATVELSKAEIEWLDKHLQGEYKRRGYRMPLNDEPVLKSVGHAVQGAITWDERACETCRGEGSPTGCGECGQ